MSVSRDSFFDSGRGRHGGSSKFAVKGSCIACSGAIRPSSISLWFSLLLRMAVSSKLSSESDSKALRVSFNFWFRECPSFDAESPEGSYTCSNFDCLGGGDGLRMSSLCDIG